MHRFLILIILVSISLKSLASETLVVIAFPKEARISDKSCSHYLKDKSQYCHDGVIELRYEIDEILFGKYDEKFINMIDFVHQSGFPTYLKEFPIVFSLAKENGYYFLTHYLKLFDFGETEGVCADGFRSKVPEASLIKVKKDISCSVGIELEKFRALLNKGMTLGNITGFESQEAHR